LLSQYVSAFFANDLADDLGIHEEAWEGVKFAVKIADLVSHGCGHTNQSTVIQEEIRRRVKLAVNDRRFSESRTGEFAVQMSCERLRMLHSKQLKSRVHVSDQAKR